MIVGTMNLTRTRDRGNFYCPTCAVPQSYRLRARRPWLTVYFIPAIPIGAVQLFVQCDICRSVWDTSVLEMNRRSHEIALEEQFRDEAIRSAVLVVLADGTISDPEIRALQLVAERILEHAVNREELGRLCSIAQQNKITAVNYVLTVSKRWSVEQRAKALQAMFLCATADGPMTKQQSGILAKMREILELTDREYELVIEDALAWEGV
jgi:uncharacterized tellurite resistance protein B-like protein